ncbi:MAG: helix-turn-helix domain-containing protein [Pyrinomonadaceae bacterium]
MDARVQAVVDLMESSYQREWSLEDLAQTINLSPSYLSHLFKAEVGVSPTHYLKSIRMRKAKELMESTFLNVKQVMYSVGVRDKCHFARDFKNIYGMSPNAYRMRLRDPAAKAKSASE